MRLYHRDFSMMTRRISGSCAPGTRFNETSTEQFGVLVVSQPGISVGVPVAESLDDCTNGEHPEQYPYPCNGLPPFPLPFSHMEPAESSRHRAESLPPSNREARARTSQSSQVSKRAGEVTIGERLQLVNEFERRKKDGDTISMPQFEKEKGITHGRFKQWYAAVKRQKEAGTQVIDPTKKRSREPKYLPIEDEMREWMAGHDDHANVPPKAIRTKAMEVAARLGIGDFSASDSWIKRFKIRYQQGQALDESATADGFIGQVGLSRRTTSSAADEDAVDQQSGHSRVNTVSMVPSTSRLTNERSPAKIQRSDERSHREGPPSLAASSEHTHLDLADSVVSSVKRRGASEEDDADQNGGPAAALSTVDSLGLELPKTRVHRRDDSASSSAARATTKMEKLMSVETVTKERNRNDAAERMKRVVAEVVDKSTSVDLVTMMDCTGSMSGWISQAQLTLNSIITDLQLSYPHMRFRVGFVGYRDFCDGAGRLAIAPLTEDVLAVKNMICRQSATGGGGEPEDVAGALKAVGDMAWEAMTRVVIHVGDAPPHGLKYHYGLNDSHPGGDPYGLRIEHLMRGFRMMGLDYCFIKINRSTDRMIDIMRAAYDDPATLHQVRVENLGGDTSGFKSFIVRSVSESVSSSVKRMSMATRTRRNHSSMFMGPTSGWLASIAEDTPLITRTLSLDTSAPAWDSFTSKEEAHRYTYHLVLERTKNWNLPEMIVTKQQSYLHIEERPFAKGEMRYAFYMKERMLDLKRVAKLPIESCRGGEELRKDVLADIETQAISKALAKVFNEALLKKGVKRMIDFIDVSVYELPSRGESERWVTVEPFMEGRYQKYNNNDGWVSLSELTQGQLAQSQLAQAFSHWTWHFTGGELMVVDIQGVNNIYIDPQIHSKDMNCYGLGNLGEEGMGKFFASHTCNEVCVRLGLDHPNPTAVEHLEGSAKQVELQISCELCGSIFDVNGSRYLSFREKGRDVYCPRCEDRLRQEVPKKVKCDRCHKPFTYPASWYLYKGMKEPTTCSRGSEQSVGVYFGEQTFRQRAANFIRAYFNLLPRE
ncbi:unnamed protein product [Vitrella brassicaformis CCMP3155]|uniref:Alpha-type protein kinase domain-containing protein n=1 Tax=Vitrella brassicaformis (strain CCMP3155) TaxID=1169540 RepID=A0A0G4GYW2_VITBC|nr:unnamed protein product [Vitrella brassicaformis CCMP3155]|eukprot:CEM36402.1 unnamed protein product [Vitrella brassicaformis CCMP3155]